MTDQPCFEVPFDEVEKWEKIQGSCARLYAAAEWGYKQALATPPPEPPKAPTDEDIHNFIQTRWHYRIANESPFGCSDYDGSRATQAGIDDVRAALERWGHA